MDIDIIYKELEIKSKKTLAHTREELIQIRTGSPTPAILESLEITTYDGQSILKLVELATITTDSSNSLLISPFDTTTLKDIEISILKSRLNLTPRVEGQILRVIFPPLSEEQRKKYVKLVLEKIEESRIALRNVRDDARRKIKNLFEEKQITEDDKYGASKEIDRISKKYCDRLDDLKKNKQDEILTV